MRREEAPFEPPRHSSPFSPAAHQLISSLVHACTAALHQKPPAAWERGSADVV